MGIVGACEGGGRNGFVCTGWGGTVAGRGSGGEGSEGEGGRTRCRLWSRLSRIWTQLQSMLSWAMGSGPTLSAPKTDSSVSASLATTLPR